MKKIAGLALFLLLTLALTACANQKQKIAGSEAVVTTATPTAAKNREHSLGANSSRLMENSTDRKILIVYFSRYGNTAYPADVDAATSASIVADKNERYGTTEYVANLIQQAVGGEVRRIETVVPYTKDFDELREVNHEEMRQNFLPELKADNLDILAYDTVFVGYPVWAGSVPQAVIAFLQQHDLAGKTVIPFCTHDGYGAGNSYQAVAEASHASVSLEGLALEAKNVPSAREAIEDWLTTIGILGSQQQQETAIQIKIGETTLEGVLYDTALAKEIKEYFPLTISMTGYAGREYYGDVSFYPQNLAGGQRNFKNGEITYCEAHHNMAIFYAQTDNPHLSVDVIPIGRVTSELSVFANLNSRENITFSLAQ